MANLDSTARADCKSKFIQAFFVGLRNTADLDDTEVQTLINDLDAALDSRAASINGDITLAVRNKASTATKFAAVAYVALKRAGII